MGNTTTTAALNAAQKGFVRRFDTADAMLAELNATYQVEAFNTDGPTYGRECPHLGSAGAVLAHYAEDFDTVLIWRKSPGLSRQLVCRFDKDGFDL